jgi:hypothetical protein
VKGELIMQDGNHQQNKGTKKQQGTLGTFAGVFTPSILIILGIILFLRLGYVVGNAGLGHALIILLLANGISVLTTISLSAIATNTEKDAAKASGDLDKKLAKLAKAEADKIDEATILQLRSKVFEAETEAEKAERRFAKADAKARSATHEAEEIGAKAPEKKDEDSDTPHKEEVTKTFCYNSS